MPTAMVTREKLAKKDYYRAQVNADQRIVALCYNAMCDHLPEESMEIIRNVVASVVTDHYRRFFKIFANKPDFQEFLMKKYLIEKVEPELRTECIELWERVKNA